MAAKGLLSQLLSLYITVLSEGPKPFLDQLTCDSALSLPGASPTIQGLVSEAPMRLPRGTFDIKFILNAVS